MSKTSIFPRWVEPQIAKAMLDTPVVLLAGPRQSGKTTVVRQIARQQGLRYLTMDDEKTLLLAREDPIRIIRGLDRAVIDEIQRAPQLLLAIKKSVDYNRLPGRFLLTSSANLMTLPTVADSLAGRVETLSIYPLSQNEIWSNSDNWIDSAYAGHILKVNQPVLDNQLVERVLLGGYPKLTSSVSHKRRISWASQYINTIVLRDVRYVAAVAKINLLPKFLRVLAQTAGQTCNYSKLGGQLGLDGKTASRYIGLFEQMYLLKRIDVWGHNHISKAVKTPKLQFIDSGLATALTNLTFNDLQKDRTRFANLLETFVFGELLKHKAMSNNNYHLMYYRDADKFKVDMIIENISGQLVGVDVKAAATIKESDLNGLKKLASLAGNQFKMGVLLYNGTDTVPLGNKILAAPLSSLWGTYSF